MKAIGKSVVGMRRKNNEDMIYVPQEHSAIQDVFIVADGMGGCNAGEVASKTAVDAFLQEYAVLSENQSCKMDVLDTLVESLTYANRMVLKKAMENKDFFQMGTTFVGTKIVQNKLYIAYVGDSRVYVQHKNQPLCQLTTDHSYVMELVKTGNISMEEAAVHPKRNVITRAVGMKEGIEADTLIEPLEEGDQVLLCSDGLSSMVSSQEMEIILNDTMLLEEKTEKLVDLANAKGGYDNISVVLIER